MNPGILAGGYAVPQMPYAPASLSGVAVWGIDRDALVLVYDTSLEPENNTISVPLNGTVDCTIDWGDGTSETHTTTGFKTKTYTSPGVYTVQIRGTMTALDYGTDPSTERNKAKLVRCLSFGRVGLNSLRNAFRGCINFVECPNSLPRDVTSLFNMFNGCAVFNQNIDNWDTAAVTTMSGVFANATSFNQPIGNWNTAAATAINNMFNNATAFNQNIGSWDTAKVTAISSMFNGAAAFNQPIGNWNTAAVVVMNSVFSRAAAFNQPIGNWNTAAVQQMGSMFQETSFDQDLSGWDIRRVGFLGMHSLFFLNSSWSNANYSATLIAWNALPDNLAAPTAITAAAPNAGRVRFTSPSHGLAQEQFINISGTTNYNGTYRVIQTNGSDHFDVTATFVGSETGTAQLIRSRFVQLDAGTAKFSASAAAARSNLVSTYNWIITDGGPE